MANELKPFSVKPLVWRHSIIGEFTPLELNAWSSDSAFQSEAYRIVESPSGKYDLHRGAYAICETLDEAKAAAQADYERRILSAIETAPATPTLSYSDGIEAAAASSVLRLTIERKIGMYGRAYDGPQDARAYTYKHQPANQAAWNLGRAVTGAAKEPGGDHIDAGLSLLRHLEEEGFGVFALVDGELVENLPAAPSDDGWQPIETAEDAKREGVDILLCLGSSQVIAHWFAPWECWISQDEDPDNPDMWLSDRYGIGPAVPTHWRPLPAPPKGAAP